MIPTALEKHPSATTQGKRKVAKRQARQAHSEDTAEARSQRLLEAMVAFRDGDFSARLPKNWSGADGRLADLFNQTISRAAPSLPAFRSISPAS